MDVTSYLLGKKAGGGGTVKNQNKNVTITENGTTTVSADAGYTGLGTVGITTNVPSGGDLSAYFETSLGAGSNWMSSIKQIPALTVNSSSLIGFFSGYNGEELPEVTYIQDITSMENFLVCQNLKTADLTGMDLDYENVFLDILEEEGQVSVQETGLDNVGYECPQLAVLDISNFDFSQLTNDFKTYFEGRQMFYSIGRECLEDDGAYADGMPLIYVKNAFSQQFVIEHGDYDESWDWDEETQEEIYNKTLLWSTDNVVIKQ